MFDAVAQWFAPVAIFRLTLQSDGHFACAPILQNVGFLFPEKGERINLNSP
jgi:hypothetical protein